MSRDKYEILVYVVDDEKEALEIYEDSLTLNFNIVTFSDSEKALEAIRTETPDVLVTDLVMPKLDGVALTRALRKDHPNLPVIVISGYGDRDQMVKLMRLGCVDFLTKPFRHQELSDKISKVISDIDMNSKKEDDQKDIVTIKEINDDLKVTFSSESLSAKTQSDVVRLQLIKLQSSIAKVIYFDFSEVDDLSVSNLIFLKNLFDSLERDKRIFHWENINAELETLLSSQLIKNKSAV